MVSEGVTANMASHIPAPSPANSDLGPVSLPWHATITYIYIQPGKNKGKNGMKKSDSRHTSWSTNAFLNFS